MYAGVEVVWRSVDSELVQWNASVVEADVCNAQFIRRHPVSHARVQYFFYLHVKIVIDNIVFVEKSHREYLHSSGVTTAPADPAMQGAREGQGPLCQPPKIVCTT